MEVKQIYGMMNSITDELLGKTDLVKEDLSNIVDVGTEIFNNASVDAYVRSLVNHIGRVIFVNRPYKGKVPSVLMDGWEYGSVLEKIRVELPEATENESWELTDGATYDPNIFYKPVVSAKFFNQKVTFEVPMSFTEMQVKQSFSNATQLNGFISMIQTAIEKSMTVKIDALVMRTITNFIGETFYAEVPGGTYTSRTGLKAVNLLYMYNQQYNKSLQAADALTDPDFIRYAGYIFGLYVDRLGTISTLFNIGATDKFTPPDMLHIVMLNEFTQAANIFLQSDVFHNTLTQLPDAETVPYWQASGDDYGFSDVSQIKITTASGHDVTATGILAVMFDRDALGVCNLSRRVTTNYNPKAEFYNNWYKFDAGYFNDTNENFVVFYVA